LSLVAHTGGGDVGCSPGTLRKNHRHEWTGVQESIPCHLVPQGWVHGCVDHTLRKTLGNTDFRILLKSARSDLNGDTVLFQDIHSGIAADQGGPFFLA
jgi:hypothetical protein